MSQTFFLQLARDTLACDAQRLGVTPEQLLQISVQVRAHVDALSAMLHLTYEITLPNPLSQKLQWPKWSPKNVTFTDYLWQTTCLECFIAADDTRYVEINASPSGAYALYAFDDYRHPASLPPPPLFIGHTGHRANIHWSTPRPHQITNSTSHYQRRFAFDLALLPNKSNESNKQLAHQTLLIHPCVILQLEQTLLYFAPVHARPPDFHKRVLWSAYHV